MSIISVKENESNRSKRNRKTQKKLTNTGKNKRVSQAIVKW